MEVESEAIIVPGLNGEREETERELAERARTGERDARHGSTHSKADQGEAPYAFGK
jgi:hypothetical protein